MSTHTHSIAKGATKTGSATVPDPNLASYATAASVATILSTDPTKVGSMANVLLRLAALEKPYTPPAPPPLTRPFSAPTTTNTVTVSGSIDHTGATDVRAALQAIIDGAANGTEIDFPGGGVYKIAYGLTIAARSNLIIDGKGAELVVSPGGYAQADSPFVITGTANDLWFRNFTLTGSSPTPGIAIIGQESQAGFKIIGAGSGVTHVEVSGNLIRNMYGDGTETIYEVYGLWVHDNTFTNNGRSNITMQCGDGYLVERNAFYLLDNNVSVVDIEPYEVPDSFCTNFTFRNNNIYGESGFAANFYFAANNTGAGQGWGNITDLTFSGNNVWNGSMRAIIGAAGPRPQRVTITNNVCHGTPQPWNPQYTAGPPKNMTGGLSINHADTVTVTGNSVTFSPSHVLAVFTDCTSVTKDF